MQKAYAGIIASFHSEFSAKQHQAAEPAPTRNSPQHLRYAHMAATAPPSPRQPPSAAAAPQAVATSACRSCTTMTFGARHPSPSLARRTAMAGRQARRRLRFWTMDGAWRRSRLPHASQLQTRRDARKRKVSERGTRGEGSMRFPSKQPRACWPPHEARHAHAHACAGCRPPAAWQHHTQD